MIADVHARERRTLSNALILMVCVAMLLLFFRDTPPSNKELISMVLGSLLTRLLDVYSFHFQSSYSSQRKDETISTLAKTAQASAPAAPSIPVDPGESVTVTGTGSAEEDTGPRTP